MLSWPSQDFSITPSDTTFLATTADSLYVGSAGSLRVTTSSGEELTLSSVPVGVLPLSVIKVFATGTSAAGIRGYVRGGESALRWRTFTMSDLTEWTGNGYFPSDVVSVERSSDLNWRLNYKMQDQLPADWKTWTKVFIDPVNGSDASPNDGSTAALAFKNLWHALSIPAITGKTLILVPDNAVFSYGATGGPWTKSSTTSATINGSFIIMPYSVFLNDGFGDATWTSSMRHALENAFSQTGTSNVFTARLASISNAPLLSNAASKNSGVVFDELSLDHFGMPKRYQKVSSAALVAQTPYSYYLDAGSRDLSVNCFSNRPDAADGLIVLNCGAANGHVPLAARDVYVVNAIFEGGAKAFVCFSDHFYTTAAMKIRCYNCTFKLSAGITQGFLVEQELPADATIDVGLYNCTSFGNGHDGISYNARSAVAEGNDALVTFTESQCISYGNGIGKFSAAGAYNKVNGFTTHCRIKGLRVACVGFGNAGPNFADTAATDSGYLSSCDIANLGCYSYNSYGDNSAKDYQTDYYATASTILTGDARIWHIDCKNASEKSKFSDSKYYFHLDASTAITLKLKFFTNSPLPPANRIRYHGGATVATFIHQPVKF